MPYNLLGNNFQIYSNELNQLILDNKTMLENTSLRPDEINMLGNKRKVNFNFANESKNTLNFDHKGKQIKNKRKISLNQAFKKTSQEIKYLLLYLRYYFSQCITFPCTCFPIAYYTSIKSL